MSISDLLAERVSEMAAQDGDTVGAIYIVGATNQLMHELLIARDNLLNAPPAAAGSAA